MPRKEPPALGPQGAGDPPLDPGLVATEVLRMQLFVLAGLRDLDGFVSK